MDDADPMASIDSLKNVGVLAKLANESSAIALNLLSANEDRVKQMEEDAEPPKRRTLADFYADNAKP